MRESTHEGFGSESEAGSGRGCDLKSMEEAGRIFLCAASWPSQSLDLLWFLAKTMKIK